MWFYGVTVKVGGERAQKEKKNLYRCQVLDS